MKLSNILSILAFLMVLSACEETLVEEPKDFISPGNFFTNQGDAEQAIAGAYSSIWVGDNYMNLFRHHAEYTLARGSWTSMGNYSVRINNDQYGRIDGIWATLYTTINRSNLVLQKVPEIVDISPEVQKRIIAEAHFLRARSYFELLKGWGPIPLRV